MSLLLLLLTQRLRDHGFAPQVLAPLFREAGQSFDLTSRRLPHISIYEQNCSLVMVPFIVAYNHTHDFANRDKLTEAWNPDDVS
jgi:hypothetical protein